MSLFNSIFKRRDKPLHSYNDFWNWFKENGKTFYKVIKDKGNIEKEFFDKLSPKLNELKDGFYYLTGMYDDKTAELVVTADGDIKNIIFVEELVNASPQIDNWKFTALKPALNINDVNVEMSGYSFNKENMGFYPNEHPGYPDEIDITIVYNDLTEENKPQIINGVYIFLDNYLGELDFATNIDNIKIVGREEAEKETISIDKLKGFLKWRHKEFIEKYDAVRHNTDDDNYSTLEAELEGGNILVAMVNSDLLNWDSKVSHPWICVFTIKYDGSNNNGMPGSDDYKTLAAIEDEMMSELKDADGYLNVGRQTAKSEREIYFACKDFRLPAKVFFKIQNKYAEKYEIEYDIYKDKYWQSLERFNPK
jgi:hypothetical protein